MKRGGFFGRQRLEGFDAEWSQRRTALFFAIGLCLATSVLFWLAYVATQQWERGAEQLQERRAAEVLVLAYAGLVRDMKGAWESLLVPVEASELDEEPPYGLLYRSAQAFAKFPYLETVVVSKRLGASSRSYAFVRSDRRPPWDRSERQEDSFPVVMLRDPMPFRSLIDQIERNEMSSGPFRVVETTISGVPYQLIAHVISDPNAAQPVTRSVTMAVNLDWVRRNYFAPILTEISTIGGLSDSAGFSVFDNQGALLARTGPPLSGGKELQRNFPLVFLETAALRPGTLPRPATKEFSVRVQRQGATGAAVVSGAFRVLLLAGLAALASIVALLQTVRALRGRVRLAVLKSEFVSAVTHELKSPLVTIRMIGDTLARGRYASTETIQEHARLLSHETAKLGHLIDHLLTYARYSESIPEAMFVAMDPSDIVEEAVDQFRLALTERDGTVEIQVPVALPKVSVEFKAVGQALEIALDNAVKYSVGAPVITVTAREKGPYVAVIVEDRGVGIHRDDLAHVRDRFFRGRNAPTGGSGLGLAIAERILTQSGGKLEIDSRLGVGTTVTLLLKKDVA